MLYKFTWLFEKKICEISKNTEKHLAHPGFLADTILTSIILLDS